MSDPSQREVDNRLEESMDLFKRADVGERTTLQPIKPTHALIAFDGSQQDETAMSLAIYLQRQSECRLSYCLVSDAARESFATHIRDSAEQAGAVEVPGEGEADYDRILSAVEASQADLLIVPCPFGRDYESIGEDSTGTVIDVMIARSPIPFIAIRRPVGDPPHPSADADAPVPAKENPTKHLRLVFTEQNKAALAAAQRALGLVAPSGKIDMLLLVEASFYDNFRAAMQAIDPTKEVSYQDLEHALARTFGPLHAALHHAAPGVNCSYELLIRNEEDEEPVTPGDPKTHPALIAIGLERENHDSQSETRDYIRRSPHPVLVTLAIHQD